jgi:hypothetical protein
VRLNRFPASRFALHAVRALPGYRSYLFAPGYHYRSLVWFRGWLCFLLHIRINGGFVYLTLYFEQPLRGVVDYVSYGRRRRACRFAERI